MYPPLRPHSPYTPFETVWNDTTSTSCSKLRQGYCCGRRAYIAEGGAHIAQNLLEAYERSLALINILLVNLVCHQEQIVRIAEASQILETNKCSCHRSKALFERAKCAVPAG
jgi:hypothetical protein